MEGLEASSLLEVGNKAGICRVEVGPCKLSEEKVETLPVLLTVWATPSAVWATAAVR